MHEALDEILGLLLLALQLSQPAASRGEVQAGVGSACLDEDRLTREPRIGEQRSKGLDRALFRGLLVLGEGIEVVIVEEVEIPINALGLEREEGLTVVEIDLLVGRAARDATEHDLCLGIDSADDLVRALHQIGVGSRRIGRADRLDLGAAEGRDEGA